MTIASAVQSPANPLAQTQAKAVADAKARNPSVGQAAQVQEQARASIKGQHQAMAAASSPRAGWTGLDLLA